MVSSRTQAQELIEKGLVFLIRKNEKIKILKSSFEIDDNTSNEVIIQENEFQKFVSRAGLKLDCALNFLKLDVSKMSVLDIGQSTGGFTDCLIQREAKKVVGIDVGHDQIHPDLKQNPKVICIEGLNAKDLKNNDQFLKSIPTELFDLVVMDVSFISITKIIPFLPDFVKKSGHYLFLVKPQFECGAALLDKNGIVKDTSVYVEIEKEIRSLVSRHFGKVEFYFESQLKGKDGNQEFFVYGKKNN